MGDQENVRSAKGLWQDYLFLTHEMTKFLTRKDDVVFTEIMSQRDKLQKMIDQTKDDAFRYSPEGQGIIAAIRQENQKISLMLRSSMNQLQHRHGVSQAYDVGQPNSGRRYDYQG